jgi:hypothetical protein
MTRGDLIERLARSEFARTCPSETWEGRSAGNRALWLRDEAWRVPVIVEFVAEWLTKVDGEWTATFWREDMS